MPKLPTTPRWLSCHPYVSFFAAIPMMLLAGNQYAISSYSTTLRETMKWDIDQLTTVAFMANCGIYLSYLPSFLSDFLGPRVASLYAAVFISVGFFGAFSMIMGWLPNIHWLFGIFFFLMGNGSFSAYTLSLTTNVKNFGVANKGLIVGILASFFGLSSTLVTILFAYVFQYKLSIFFAFMSGAGLVIPLFIGFPFITLKHKQSAAKAKPEQKETTRLMLRRDTSDETLPLVAEQQRILPAYVDGDMEAAKRQGQSGLHINTQIPEENPATPVFDGYSPVVATTPVVPELPKASPQSLEPEHIKAIMEQPLFKHKDHSILWILLSVDFWLISVVFFGVIGGGILVINNLGSVVVSYGGKDGDQTVAVIVLSLVNCAGRLVFGFLSDRFRHVMSRVGFICLTAVGMGISLFCFAYVPLGWPLAVNAGLVGFFYGGNFALTPPFLSDRFGNRNLAMLTSLIMLGAMAGSFGIAKGLVSLFYNLPLTDGRHKCLYRHCFAPTFLVASGISFTTFFVGLILAWRSRTMYTKRREYFLSYEDYVASKYYQEETKQ